MPTASDALCRPGRRPAARASVATALATPLILLTALPSHAYTTPERKEQLRYAEETVQLTYPEFIRRKADFMRAGCRAENHVYLGQPTDGCTKPSPYNAFDWTDDGCSGRDQLGPISLVYRNLFNQPCQLHDFGYRNFGKGLQLDRSENRRAMIDSRFLSEMRRVCNATYRSRPVALATCHSTALAVYTLVRNGSNWNTPGPYYIPATPPAAPPLAPPAAPPAPAATKGFTIEDSFLGGTWARTDPSNGTWYSRSNRPTNGAYWYPNGLGVGVDCARRAAAYTVKFADGRAEQWTTWFHVTDGKWFPSAASRQATSDGSYGLPTC